MAKNTKLAYYLRSYSLLLCPKFILRRILRCRMKEIASSAERDYIMERVDYYNKLKDGATLPADAPMLQEHTLKNKKCGSVYFFDTYEFTRYFKETFRWMLKGGDVTTVPPCPTIVKSRPIAGDNANSVLMKLNKVRHFRAGGFVELQKEVEAFGIEDKSLKKMAAIILGVSVSKAQRLSNWEAKEYTPAQMRYAATDAWICLEMYNKLQKSK